MRLTSVLSVFLSLAIVSHGAPINLSKRSFGNESSPEAVNVFQELKTVTQGTDKEAEGAELSVSVIEALFADAPACDQQDKADEIIDLGHTLGGEKENQLIQIATTYRQLERNTPEAGQPSELCAKPPKNKEINGLLQAQDTAGTTTPGATPNEPVLDYSAKTATPNEPDPDDPAKTATPNEPDPDDPAKTATPNEPDPDDPAKQDKGSEPDPDDSADNNAPPNKADQDDSNSASNDDSGNVLPKDPDEDSESNNDGSSAKSNMPQDFA